MKLKDYLKQYRKENNLTQEGLANLLFVSKQAVSKWETDKGLPDIETYKEISKLLGVSVDVLLGLEERKQESKENKSLVIICIISLCLVLILGIIATIVAITTTNNKPVDESEVLKKELLAKTEEELNVALPPVSSYEYIDYNEWIIAGNILLPRKMYYFVFEDEVIVTDNLWLQELDEEMINSIPINLNGYLDTFDYFKIIDTTTGEINVINLNDDEIHTYSLYCFDSDNKRLVVIKFEV